MLEIIITWIALFVFSCLVFGGVIPLFTTCLVASAVTSWFRRYRDTHVERTFSRTFFALHWGVYVTLLLWAITGGQLMPENAANNLPPILSLERMGDITCFVAGASLFPLFWLREFKQRAGFIKKGKD